MKYLFLIFSFSTFAGTFDSLIVLKKLKDKKDYSIEFCRLTEKQKEFVIEKGAKEVECFNDNIARYKKTLSNAKKEKKK